MGLDTSSEPQKIFFRDCCYNLRQQEHVYTIIGDTSGVPLNSHA
jgi:hypothetical protein